MFRRKSKKTHKKSHRQKEEDGLLQQVGREIEDGVKSIEATLEEIGDEINREVKTATHKIRRKIGLFYKASLLLLLIASIILSYFVILVSTTPKSFPFVTQKIREQLRQHYGNSVTLDNAYISFTRYGTLKVSVKNLKIFRVENKGPNSEKHEFLIPQIDGEFSLMNLLYSSYMPRKIKVIDPKIVINDLWSEGQNSEDAINPVSEVVALLSKVRRESFFTKSFEIENARLIFKSKIGDKEIIIKKSQIRTAVKRGTLYFSSMNQFNFSENNRSDVNLNSSCKMGDYDILKCDVVLVNFSTNAISDLHPDLRALEQIEVTANITTSFTVDNGKFHNVTFNAEAKNGNFSFPEFFGEKMFFTDFAVRGDYDDGPGILNLSDIKADLKLHNDADVANPNSLTLKTHLDMSLMISDVSNWQNHHSDFYIKLRNAPTNELEKLWPVYLQDCGIRQWVIEHIKNGVVRDAYARFSLAKNGDKIELEKIDSSLSFDGLDLKYEEDFPEITKINGTAKFAKNNMDIVVNSGNVLGSRIYDSHVTIDDFNAPVTMLKILGKSHGSASDGLKHADSSPKFSSEIEKYLNGSSQNNFDIRIPLGENIELKDTYIAVDSAISNLSNEYIKGAINASVKKDFGSKDFVASLGLTESELMIENFNIQKKSGDEGGLNLTIAFPSPKKIDLKNILLWKKEKIVLRDKQQAISGKISGNISFETAPFAFSTLNLKNENFGRNSYAISYGTDQKSSVAKLLIRGQVLDLAPTIQSKFKDFKSSGKIFKSTTVQVALDNLLLANSKSIRNFTFGLKCSGQFCYSGIARGSYNKKEQSLDLHLAKKPEENFASLEGQITDVGYLAEAFGISNVVAGGNAHLNLQHKIVDQKPVLDGAIEFDDSITIYENPTVKRLATNDLFSKVRDKIFSEDKTIFDSVKIDFALSEGKIDLRSLIANNYKIGITAKGLLDLKNDAYNIKGMIVPGFIVNNLFGIGNIPVIGNVVELLTGGEGGGLFGIRYEYVKKQGDKEATFETNKVSSFVPTTIKNLFDLI